jgi:hypothetical protein
MASIEQDYIILNYSQLPFMPGMEIMASWEQDKNILFSGGIGMGGGALRVHPYNVVTMMYETRGSDYALELLRLFMRWRIKNLTNEYFKDLC